MAKKVKAKNKKTGLISKLVKPFVAVLGIVVVALVVIINPFNIPKILKNNYPQGIFKH